MRADGLPELIKDLSTAAERAGRRSSKVVGETAKRVRSGAAERAPKGSRPHGGEDLAQSIEATEISEGVWEVGPTARHGSFVEYGTYKDQPQPYLFPAAHDAERELAEGIAEIGGDV